MRRVFFKLLFFATFLRTPKKPQPYFLTTLHKFNHIPFLDSWFKNINKFKKIYLVKNYNYLVKNKLTKNILTATCMYVNIVVRLLLIVKRILIVLLLSKNLVRIYYILEWWLFIYNVLSLCNYLIVVLMYLKDCCYCWVLLLVINSRVWWGGESTSFFHIPTVFHRIKYYKSSCIWVYYLQGSLVLGFSKKPSNVFATLGACYYGNIKVAIFLN